MASALATVAPRHTAVAPDTGLAIGAVVVIMMVRFLRSGAPGEIRTPDPQVRNVNRSLCGDWRLIELSESPLRAGFLQFSQRYCHPAAAGISHNSVGTKQRHQASKLRRYDRARRTQPHPANARCAGASPRHVGIGASQGSREAKAVGMLISAAMLVKLVPSPLQSGASAMAWRRRLPTVPLPRSA